MLKLNSKTFNTKPEAREWALNEFSKETFVQFCKTGNKWGCLVSDTKPKAVHIINSVPERVAGTVGYDIWAVCNVIYEDGTLPTLKALEPFIDDNKWNTNNVKTELYKWELFNGVRNKFH